MPNLFGGCGRAVYFPGKSAPVRHTSAPSSPPVLLRHALFPRHAESLPSSAMSVPFGTPLLSRPIAAIGLPAARPCIVSRPGLFPDIRPVSTLLMTDYPLLYLPCPGIPFLGIRPPRPRPSPSLLVPSRPFSSLLVPSRPFSSLLVPSSVFPVSGPGRAGRFFGRPAILA